jgi:hypothetical protein
VGPKNEQESPMPNRTTATYVRTPAFAGKLYPDDRDALHATVHRLLQAQNAQPDEVRFPKALIVPHGSYASSGLITAAAYATLRSVRSRISRVVMFGAAHGVLFRGLATSGAEAFATPLGHVALDRDAIHATLQFPQVQVLDEAHHDEPALEVQLPFLQEALGAFSLVPFLLGNVEPEETSEVLEYLWGGPETLIVISSDLSQDHDSRTCRELDTATSQAIESLQPEALEIHSACGRTAIAALLALAPQHHLRARLLAWGNSGETSGDSNRVVGYGAYAFAQTAEA